MVVLARWEFQVPGARSLKRKRASLRSMKDRLRPFNVSVAETAFQDLWARGELSVVFISPSRARADATVERVDRKLEGVRGVRLMSPSVEMLA